MEMERWRKLRLFTSSFVLSLGSLAAAFSFVSEITRVRADQVVVIVGDDDDDYCVYPSSRSSTWEMGIVAAASLFMSQLIASIMACGGCISNSYCKTSNSSSRKMRSMAILCLVLSWISFGNAIFLLLEGVALNGRQKNLIGQGGIHGCYVVKAGVYGVAGVLCMFTCGLNTMYYWITTSRTTTITWEDQRDDDDDDSVGAKNGHLPVSPPPPLVAHMAPILYSNHSASPPIPYIGGFEELPKRYSQFFQL